MMQKVFRKYDKCILSKSVTCNNMGFTSISHMSMLFPSASAYIFALGAITTCIGLILGCCGATHCMGALTKLQTMYIATLVCAICTCVFDIIEGKDFPISNSCYLIGITIQLIVVLLPSGVKYCFMRRVQYNPAIIDV